MNTSPVRRIAVALALIGVLFLFRTDGVAACKESRSDPPCPFVARSAIQADITLGLAEEIPPKFPVNGKEGVVVASWSPTFDEVGAGRIQNWLEILQKGIARGLAPPVLESV